MTCFPVFLLHTNASVDVSLFFFVSSLTKMSLFFFLVWVVTFGRASVREMEPLTEGKPRRSKAPHGDRTNVPLPETRRSVSLPRGKMALV